MSIWLQLKMTHNGNILQFTVLQLWSYLYQLKHFFYYMEIIAAWYSGFSLESLKVIFYTIGLRKWRHFFIQSEIKSKPITIRFHTFVRYT